MSDRQNRSEEVQGLADIDQGRYSTPFADGSPARAGSAVPISSR
jgi:hypothetical protein